MPLSGEIPSLAYFTFSPSSATTLRKMPRHHRQKYAFLLLPSYPGFQIVKPSCVNLEFSFSTDSDCSIELHWLHSPILKNSSATCSCPLALHTFLKGVHWKDDMFHYWRQGASTPAFCWTISVHCDSGIPEKSKKRTSPLEEGEVSSP